MRTLYKYLLLLLFAFLISTFHYCFSPISELAGHPDPGCFYMAGKSWAHGLTPYVDFIDIKGPLLFAFFAVGYLIHGVDGVFLLLTLTLFGSLIGVYKIGKLYKLSDEYAFLLVSVFLVFYVSCFWSHGRAEDIMLPLLIWAIYACLNCVVNNANMWSLTLCALSLGGSGAVITLIKYNAILPLLMMAVYMLFFCFKQRLRARTIINFALVGTLSYVLVVAWVACALYFQGALISCLDVYFNVTKATSMVGGKGTERLLVEFVKPGSLFVIILTTIGAWLYFTIRKNSKWIFAFWLVFALGGWSACIYGGIRYYWIICTPLVIFPCALLLSLFEPRSGAKYITWALSALLLCLALQNDVNDAVVRLGHREHYPNPLDDEICKVKNARLLYIGILDQGFGAGCDALPACPYWMSLNGDVFNSKERQWECVEKHIPDFVITRAESKENPEVFLRLQRNGYAHILTEPALYQDKWRQRSCLWKKIN